MSQKIDIRERRYNGTDYDTLHPETNINMVLDSGGNSVGGVKGALYGDGNGNIVGATISNPNLLDNAWFTVNQRGQSSYSANGFTVDRWEKRMSDFTKLTVSPVTSGLLFTKTSGAYGYFQQKISRVIDEDATYTLSLKDNSGNIYTLTAPFIATTSAQKYITINGVEVGLGLFGKGATPYVAIAFPAASSGNFTLRAVKLELGSVSTLGNDVAPNYYLELAKCQVYFVRIKMSSNYSALGLGICTTNGTVAIYIPKPYNMRPITSINYSGSFKAYALNLSANYDVSNATLGSGTTNNIPIVFSVEGTTAGTIYFLQSNNDANAYIDLIADL